ncbi:hypothetical protein THAOC_35134, partial [Thalassiosira oceanica]
DPKLVDSFLQSSLTLVADPLGESAVTGLQRRHAFASPCAPSITKPPSVTSTTATPVVPATISADDIGDVQPPSSDLGIHSPEGVNDIAALAVPAPERVTTEDWVPEGAVDSTTADPSAAASTKAAVNISSHRASKAPVIVSEGACAEQGPMAVNQVNPRAAISCFFHETLCPPPWLPEVMFWA